MLFGTRLLAFAVVVFTSAMGYAGGNVEACKARCDVELENNMRKCDSAPPENRRACRQHAQGVIYPRCLRDCETRDCPLDIDLSLCIDPAWTTFSENDE